MLKESLLLVASTGVLIYFVTPSEEPPQVQPVVEEAPAIIQAEPPEPEDSWEADDSEDGGDENFVFGEPMTIAGSESQEPWDEDTTPSLQYQPDKVTSKTRYSGSSARPLAGSPRPGELGSQQNPIERNNGGPPPVDMDDF